LNQLSSLNKVQILRNLANSAFGADRKLRLWKDNGFTAPAPLSVKHAVLFREGIDRGIWVETGTYLGQTTAALSSRGWTVYSVEADAELYSRAVKKFSDTSNVSVSHGASESVLEDLLPTLSGPVNFWLDAHYSGSSTYGAGANSPIAGELSVIEKNLPSISPICVLVDDLRCFNDDAGKYPSLNWLVDWATRNKLVWHIEHDIFVAKSGDIAV